MSYRTIVPILLAACIAPALAASPPERSVREFRAASGGKLVLDLQAGGTARITGTAESSISVTYGHACRPACEVAFDETKDGLRIETRFTGEGRTQNSNVELEIRVPSRYDVQLDSVGGGLSIDGVEGTFDGKTMGGELTLHAVRGTAELTTMGGRISVTDSDLDGALKTMGGEVLFENVVGDVKGSSMGGNVRYKNVRRRDGRNGAPERTGADLDEITPETVQISTMGGAIELEEAPEGADLHTMGGNIKVEDAHGFVRAKTMGGDIDIDAVDGWVQATTMAGDVDVALVGAGGDVTLTSMSGDVTLHVPPGFGMRLELEIAYTRNSAQDFRIDAPGGLRPTVSPDWDYEHGSARKYIRASGPAGGGGHAVKITTVNGNITVREGR